MTKTSHGETLESLRWELGNDHMKLRSSIKAVAIVLAVACLTLGGCQWYYNTHKTSAAIAPCVNNLMIIDMCKQNWANVNGKKSTDVPTWGDLKEELESYAIHYGWSNGIPVCPDGGTYTIGRVGEQPTCSVGGPMHSLPR